MRFPVVGGRMMMMRSYVGAFTAAAILYFFFLFVWLVGVKNKHKKQRTTETTHLALHIRDE